MLKFQFLPHHFFTQPVLHKHSLAFLLLIEDEIETCLCVSHEFLMEPSNNSGNTYTLFLLALFTVATSVTVLWYNEHCGLESLGEIYV